MEDIRNEMTHEIHNMYMTNMIFRSCFNRCMNHGFSYLRCIETSLRYFVALQEQKDQSEFEKIMVSPNYTKFITEDEIKAFSLIEL